MQPRFLVKAGKLFSPKQHEITWQMQSIITKQHDHHICNKRIETSDLQGIVNLNLLTSWKQQLTKPLNQVITNKKHHQCTRHEVLLTYHETKALSLLSMSKS
jgi:hypothetical protein